MKIKKKTRQKIICIACAGTGVSGMAGEECIICGGKGEL